MANWGEAYCLLCAVSKPLTASTDVGNQIEEINRKLNRINATAYLQFINLPKRVCSVCLSFLEGSYDFVLAVERAQHVLLDLNVDAKHQISFFQETGTVLKIEPETDNIDVEKNHNEELTVNKAVTSTFKIENVTKEKDKVHFDKILKEEHPSSSFTSHSYISITVTPDIITETENLALKNYNEEVPPIPSIKPHASALNSTDAKEKKLKKLVKVQQKSKKKTSQPLLNPPSTWQDYIWKCSMCDTEFPNQDELKTHSMEYHKCCNVYRCYDCGMRKSYLDQFTKHIRQHRRHLSYSCYICLKSFPTACKAGRHQQIHRTSPYYCKGCNTKFKTDLQLKEHTSTYFKLLCAQTAPKSDNVYCKECDKTYGDPQALNRHMKLVHTNLTKDYVCDTCGKSFHKKSNLSIHMFVHTDERPFPCTICSQRFKRDRHLTKHMNRMHRASGQYICDVCNRSFKFESYLKKHQIVHTNLLPHVCKYCNKGFKHRTNLKNHTRLHTGDKPYGCSICERQFTNWPNYNKHMKRRHNMDMSKRKTVNQNQGISESMMESIETVYTKKKRQNIKSITGDGNENDQSRIEVVLDHN